MITVGDLMKVTRDDIQDFPGDTIELILELQKEGWRANRSNRNHVMLLAPDGVTRYSASRNANSAKYLAEDIARYKRGDKSLTPEVIAEMEKEAEMPTPKKFPCPQKDCQKSFASQDHLNVHIGVDHEGMLACPEKGCFELFTSPAALGRHRQAKHGYVSPRKEQRKKQEFEREKRRSQKVQADKAELEEVLHATTDGSQDVSQVDEPTNTQFTGDEEIVHETDHIVMGDPVEWDPKLGPRPNWLVDSAGVTHDVVDVRPMTERERQFKDLAANADPLKIHFHQTVNEPGRLSAAEIYRQTAGQLDATGSLEVVRTDDLEFIDSRDSWVLEHDDILDRRIGTLEQILSAAGLKMEIRVWKEDS